jgi:hypothetical protein
MVAGLPQATADVQPRVSVGDILLPAMAAAIPLLAATVVVDPLMAAADRRMAVVDRRMAADPMAEVTGGDFTPVSGRRSKAATLYPAVGRA